MASEFGAGRVSEFDDVVQMHRMAWAMAIRNYALSRMVDAAQELSNSLDELRAALEDLEDHLANLDDIEDNE